MKLYECNIGDKVKIIGGLKHGCQGKKDKPGIVISKEDFYLKKETKIFIGWIPENHPKDIGFVETEDCVYSVNNNCEVELLERANIKETKNIKEKIKDMKNFKIVDYKVYNNKAVNVTFKDAVGKPETEEKAVCNEEDKFDLSRALEICVLKHILGEDTYKQIIKEISRQVKAIDKAAKDKKELEEMIARKRAKNARRKARRQEKARQERIDEIKEAYLAAMIEYNSVDCEEVVEAVN